MTADSHESVSAPAETGQDQWLETRRIRAIYSNGQLEFWQLRQGEPCKLIEAFDPGATAMFREWLAALP